MTDFDLFTSCCFSGHRNLGNDFSAEKVEEIIKKLIDGGFKTFLVGMALGFDVEVMKILVKYKGRNIDIIACVPCPEQSNYYSKENKEIYNELLSKADKIVYVSDHYTKGCMLKRNRYMVDNTGLLVAYYKTEKTGTEYTVNYAKKQGKSIILI